MANSTNTRDNFSAPTRAILAARSGHRCSFPGCDQATEGPSNEGSDATASIGEACHITAASPGGRRYDPNMTSEERLSAENGIWMCRTHGALIDRDDIAYTVSVIHKWKQDAEDRAKKRIENTDYTEERIPCTPLPTAQKIIQSNIETSDIGVTFHDHGPRGFRQTWTRVPRPWFLVSSSGLVVQSFLRV